MGISSVECDDASKQGRQEDTENPRLTHHTLAIFKRSLEHDAAPNDETDDNPPNDTTDKMRVYEDSFSGQKIYPGKVRNAAVPRPRRRAWEREYQGLKG